MDRIKTENPLANWAPKAILSGNECGHFEKRLRSFFKTTAVVFQNHCSRFLPALLLLGFWFAIPAALRAQNSDTLAVAADAAAEVADSVAEVAGNVSAEKADTAAQVGFVRYYDAAERRVIRYPHRDSTWVNFATGSRVHFIRLTRQDTLVTPDRAVAKPILESLAINFGVWGYDHWVKDRGWADVTSRTIHHNLTHDFVLDNDSYSGNQFSHPYHGSMFYNAARYHGHSYYTAALYPLIGSMVWEYFCETNRPAYNDFLSTGIGGTAIGEATFRASDLIFDNSKTGLGRVVRELAGSILNPARGIHRLFSGEMWRVSPVRGKHIQPAPFSAEVGVGNRYMRELRHHNRHKNVSYVDFLLLYGDHFWLQKDPKPFDYFRLHILLNTTPSQPTFSDVDIRGRLFGKQLEGRRGWQVDWAVYQNFRYLDNYGQKHEQNPGDYALHCEAVSFGVGSYQQRIGKHHTFSNDFVFNIVPFGACTSDYYEARRYNFATGFSLRNEIRYSFNSRFTIGNDTYFARYFVPKGGRRPDLRSDYYWGDRGHSSIWLSRTYVLVNVHRYLKAKAEHLLYYRRSYYTYYPEHHGKSIEVNLGLVYSL